MKKKLPSRTKRMAEQRRVPKQERYDLAMALIVKGETNAEINRILASNDLRGLSPTTLAKLRKHVARAKPKAPDASGITVGDTLKLVMQFMLDSKIRKFEVIDGQFYVTKHF